MRTWAKVMLGCAVLIGAAFLALAGTGAYYVFRGMERRAAAETEAMREIEAVRTRFGQRPPLVEIVDARRADIRINRASDAGAARVSTIHILNWKSETGELMRTEAPLWLLRFSTLNIASQLGLAPASFRLTVSDIERYGPGIVVDYAAERTVRVLVWVD